tara:strand:- start:169 stop:765 length:597 start_codon:yes stop_codon:yes gene_type:complete
MVTASNGFLQLFSLDKNYFEYAITTEQLKTEGWQFFELSGKYEDDETHQEAYKVFCKSVENIKRKQVEKEFPGKADVNKNKKGKKFDFQEELKKNLPDHLKGQLEDKKTDPEKGESKSDPKVDTTKIDEISNLMNDKMGKLDAFMNILEKKNIDGDAAATIGNVKEIFTDSIKEQVTAAASEAVSEAIDKVEVKKVDK